MDCASAVNVIEMARAKTTPVPVRDESLPHGIKGLAVKWLLEQGVSTVLLAVLVGLIVWFAISVLPKHLDAVQAGYDRQEKSHSEAVKEIAKMAREDREQDREIFLNIVREIKNNP